MCWDNLFSGLLWSCPSAICLHKQIVYSLDGGITVTRRWDLLKGLLECCKVSSGTSGCYSAHWRGLKRTENSVITTWLLVFLWTSGAAYTLHGYKGGISSSKHSALFRKEQQNKSFHWEFRSQILCHHWPNPARAPSCLFGSSGAQRTERKCPARLVIMFVSVYFRR